MSHAEARAPGSVVGRYVLHDEIASGGMAAVHLGRLLGPAGFTRTVAIKRLHPEHARDPEFVAMFLDEARLAARIRHPNVVPIVDVVALSGQLFLVMEYIQGESLSRLLRAAQSRGQRVPLSIGLTVLTEALYGLHAAHEAHDERGEPLSIVHRDVSPHNILVGRDGAARVLDFGIAKAASRASTTRDGKVKGKFTYMAPEQLRRGPVDRRADIFAASIVLWEVLTGERLFAAEDLAGIVARVLNETIEAPSTRVPSLSPAIDAIAMKGLERDPDRRYATAWEMAKALEALGGLARPAEVGAWVEEISGEVLRKRAAQVKEIESDSIGSVPLPEGEPFLPKPPQVGEPTMQLEEPAGLTMNMRAAEPAAEEEEQDVAPAPAPRRARWAALAGTLVLALALGIGWWTRGSSAPAAASPEAVRGAIAPADAPSASGPEPVVAAPASSAAAAPAAAAASAAPAAAAPAASATPEAAPAPAPAANAEPAAAPVATTERPRPARARPHRAAPAKGAKPDCSPNYFFDSDGIKRFKPECI